MGFGIPSNQSLPFLLTAIEDKWISFEFDASTVINDKNERGWNCFIIEAQNIRQDGQQIAEDGQHEIPFWAMMPFFEAFGHMNGMISVQAKITKSGLKNIAKFRMD